MNTLGTFVIVNDKLTRRNEVVFGLESRAVRFSDGFFESMRAFGLDVPLLAFHYERIKKAWCIYRFDSEIPSIKTLSDAIERLLKSNKHFGSARIRLTFYRSGEGLYLPTKNQADWYLETFASDDKEFTLNTKGKQIGIYSDFYKPSHPFFNIKTNQALIYTQAAWWAQINNLDDAILLNKQQCLIEATSSNIFVCIGNIVYTPPLTDGCVNGVMRRFLIQELFPSLDIEYKEVSLTKQFLLDADEVFLSNAVQGIQWVVGFQNRRYFNSLAKKITQKLNDFRLQS
ncbi:MAG: aminotransferase class IV [Bacteroidales bacterium]|nr:aminotransferase class IV [Bacteroidales bacterium]